MSTSAPRTKPRSISGNVASWPISTVAPASGGCRAEVFVEHLPAHAVGDRADDRGVSASRRRSSSAEGAPSGRRRRRPTRASVRRAVRARPSTRRTPSRRCAGGSSVVRLDVERRQLGDGTWGEQITARLVARAGPASRASVTRCPARARPIAVAAPAGPPPTTSTSASSTASSTSGVAGDQGDPGTGTSPIGIISIGVPAASTALSCSVARS